MQDYDLSDFKIDCTGDVCKGDIIYFTESVFSTYSRYSKSKYLGTRTIVGEVVSESYGKHKQQHTFTIKPIASFGYDPIPLIKNIRRKGRNIYRNTTKRLPWDNEDNRKPVLQEKHERGNIARLHRKIRQNYEPDFT